MLAVTFGALLVLWCRDSNTARPPRGCRSGMLARPDSDPAVTEQQRIYPDEQRGQAMARVRMFANLVGMGSVIAGGALLEIADVRSVLGASALISFAAPLFLMFMRYEIDRDRRPMPSPIRLGSVALQDTAFRRYLVATTFIGFGNAMGGTAYPI